MDIKVSIGEIIDKLSILEVKKNKIVDTEKLKNITIEYDYLLEKLKPLAIGEYSELYDVNLLLWDVEDNIRIKENMKEFDDEFIMFARKVYFFNDKRAEIKRRINIKYNSEFIEEKSYEKY